MPLVYLLIGLWAGIAFTQTQQFRDALNDEDVEEELRVACVQAAGVISVEGLFWDVKAKAYFADIEDIDLDKLIVGSFLVQEDGVTYHPISRKHRRGTDRMRPILVTHAMYDQIKRCLA